MLNEIKMNFEKIKKKILINDVEFHGYYILLISGIAASILGGFINLSLGFPPLSYIILFIGVIFLNVSLFLFMKNIRKYLIIESTLIYLCYIMIPVLWLYTGGFKGTTIYYSFMLVIIAPAFLKGWRRILHPVIFILLNIVLIYIEIMYPETIYSHNSEKERFFDVILNFPITLLFTSVIIDLILQKYRANHEKLIKVSMYDDLTGVYNRRYIMEYLEFKFSEPENQRINSCVMLLDFDDFKGINDTMGHIYGDKIIKKVGKIISDRLDEQNKLGRIGGDEFVIFIQEADRHKISELCSSILEKVSTELNITLSIGIAFFSNSKDLGELISNADRNLYVAKNTGKNNYKM